MARTQNRQRHSTKQNLHLNPFSFLTGKFNISKTRLFATQKMTRLKLSSIFAIVLSLAVFSSVMFCLTPVTANFHEPPAIMQLVSPANNAVYNQTSILLNATILLRQYMWTNSSFEFEDMRWLNYSLDDQPAVALILTRQYNKNGPGYNEFGLCTLSNLPEGLHYIRVYGESTFNATLNTTNYFTIMQVNTTPSVSTMTPSPSPTDRPISTISSTPTVPELSWLALLLLISTVVFVTLLLKRRGNA
jgi:hypothetical protein